MTAGVVLPVVGGVMVALIGGWATYRTAKVARMANDRTAAIEGWQQWRIDAQELRKERDALAAAIAKNRRDCEEATRRVKDELRIVERRLDGCVEWIRAVIPVLKAQGIPYPPVPKGITDTDPGMTAYRRS